MSLPQFSARLAGIGRLVSRRIRLVWEIVGAAVSKGAALPGSGKPDWLCLSDAGSLSGMQEAGG